MKALKTALIAVLTSAATVIVTNLITGQPLTGVVKLKGLAQTFLKSSVPAWGFALTFFVAALGAYYFVVHLRNKLTKGKVHFVQDTKECLWSQQGESMTVKINGTFTYEGKDNLIVLQAFLKGTTATSSMIFKKEWDGRMQLLEELWLEPREPNYLSMTLSLRPLVGKPLQPLHTQLMLRDRFNRHFSVPLTLPYLGQK